MSARFWNGAVQSAWSHKVVPLPTQVVSNKQGDQVARCQAHLTLTHSHTDGLLRGNCQLLAELLDSEESPVAGRLLRMSTG